MNPIATTHAAARVRRQRQTYVRTGANASGTAASLAALTAAVTLAVAGCGGGGGEDAGSVDGAGSSSPMAPSSSSEPAVEGDVVVLAASSLTESFSTLGDDFMAANPAVTVTFSFGASSALAQQVTAGAPADVFAAASPSTMAVVSDAGLADGQPVVFVRNQLEIAVPTGNPAGITGLADLTNEDLTIALCAAEVPCGAAAAEVFDAAGLMAAPDTLEQDAKATLTKVELGEVDAALVYRTDVLAAGQTVEGIEFPESTEAINDYPIVMLADAPNPGAAQAFLDYVLSDDGLQVLADAGFEID